jgi:hypothetical protein
MSVHRFVASVLLLLAVPSFAVAQDATRLKINVIHTGEDSVGRSVVNALREEIFRSSEFVLGDSDDAMIVINIVSLDAAGAAGAEGVRSAISVVYTMSNYLPLDKTNPQTWYPIFLTSAIRLVGRERAVPVAKDIVATLEAEMREFRSAARQQ